MGNFKNILDIIKVKHPLFYEIEKNLHKGVVLFGAGQNGRWCLDYLKRQNINVKYFLDNSPQLHNTKIEGIPVITSAEYRDRKLDLVILITSKHYASEIEKTLADIKLKMSFDCWFLIKNIEKYKEISNIFYDKKSNQTLATIMKTMLTSDNKYLLDIVEQNQYFSLPGFFNSMNESFVDIGAYTGDTVERFIQSQNGSFKHIWAFEPCKPQFDAMNYRIERLKKEWLIDNQISTENIAFSDTKTTCSVVSENKPQSAMINNDVKNEQIIQVETLDNYFYDKKITFLKMDAEGSEINILQGGGGGNISMAA